MGGRVGLPPDAALSVASPLGRSRPVPAAPSAPRVSSPSSLSPRRVDLASRSLSSSAVGSAGAQRDLRPLGPRPPPP
eukprot:5020898-Pleurochrysis_carterae.AAC.2